MGAQEGRLGTEPIEKQSEQDREHPRDKRKFTVCHEPGVAHQYPHVARRDHGSRKHDDDVVVESRCTAGLGLRNIITALASRRAGEAF
jgi:hypothetical protein